MDSQGPGAGSYASADERRIQQVDNAIRAIQEKKPIPEIDFSIHTMEDGTQVSTMERVCKGESATPAVTSPSPCGTPKLSQDSIVADSRAPISRCPVACHVQAHR
jgi:hypothetical protein